MEIWKNGNLEKQKFGKMEIGKMEILNNGNFDKEEFGKNGNL